MTAPRAYPSSDKSVQIIDEPTFLRATSLPPIQFVLGDFNIDPRVDSAMGYVGALPCSTLCAAQQFHSTMGTNDMEQYSNSTNTKHFMGHLVVDPRVTLGGKMGLSLQRSMGGELFSGHPPSSSSSRCMIEREGMGGTTAQRGMGTSTVVVLTSS